MKIPNWVVFIIAIIVPNLQGFLSSLTNTQANREEWYEKLNFPSFRPPNWLFLPAWTVLYCCMGLGSFLVWKDGDGFSGKARCPLIVYIIQLTLNFFWSIIFFGFRSILGGLIEIVFLDIAVLICAILFFRINRFAGILLIPYLGWLSFATALNYSIWDLNDRPGFISK